MLIRFEDSTLFFDENADSGYSRSEIIGLYWGAHPRFRFVKACRNGNFLDIGSGSGSLSGWKKWKQPVRDQLNMYAVDLQVGEFAGQYEAFKIFDLEQPDFPYEENFFDHVLSAHVFEHLKNPENLVKNIAKILKDGGMAYIEQPNPNSVHVPGLLDFQKAGIQCAKITTNFYDDCTHVRPYAADEVIALFQQYAKDAFEVIEKGTIWNDYLADIMFSFAYRNQDTEIWTYATWLHYLWSDYVVLRKKG